MPIVILIIFLVLVVLAILAAAAIAAVIAAIVGGFVVFGVGYVLGELMELAFNHTVKPAYYYSKDRILDYRAEKKRQKRIREVEAERLKALRDAEAEKLRALHEEFERGKRKVLRWK